MLIIWKCRKQMKSRVLSVFFFCPQNMLKTCIFSLLSNNQKAAVLIEVMVVKEKPKN